MTTDNTEQKPFDAAAFCDALPAWTPDVWCDAIVWIGDPGDGFRACDVRGWGHLTAKLRMSPQDARAVQEELCRRIAAAPLLLQYAEASYASIAHRQECIVCRAGFQPCADAALLTDRCITLLQSALCAAKPGEYEASV